jgi:hypothetical protein
MCFTGETYIYSKRRNLGKTTNSIDKQTKVFVDVIEGCTSDDTSASRRRGTGGEPTNARFGLPPGRCHELVELLGRVQDRRAVSRGIMVAEQPTQENQTTRFLPARGRDLPPM